MQITVLGQVYSIETCVDPKEDEVLKDGACDGYCNNVLKKIVAADYYKTGTNENLTPEEYAWIEKKVLRHEILHAFIIESGLWQDSTSCDAWALNEEMVDWFAIQSPKIYKVYQEVGCL